MLKHEEKTLKEIKDGKRKSKREIDRERESEIKRRR